MTLILPPVEDRRVVHPGILRLEEGILIASRPRFNGNPIQPGIHERRGEQAAWKKS
jgi:hypothetical protein